MGGREDDFLRTKGFVITISEVSASGRGEKESWLTCSGGGDVIEIASTTHGGDLHHACTQGRSTVSPICLEGYLTTDRKASLTWLKLTADGKVPRRNVTVTPYDIEQKATKAHNYFDCLIEEYVFPELSAQVHSTLKERVTVRPERHEIH